MAIDPTYLEQLKKLNFLSRKKVSSIYVGGRKSIHQGRGIGVADHREYYPGDDFRSIDWKLYGRVERLYVKRYEEEKSLTLRMLIDTSASMRFTTTDITKFDYAGSIAAGFAYIAMNRYEKFTASMYSNTVQEVMQAKKGKMQFFRMIDLLNNSRQRGETNLKKCMAQYTSMIKSKSFIVVISDFMEPIETLIEGIYRIAKHSREAILIQVLDPGEFNLKWRDDIRFEDMETDESERAYLSPGFKREYKRRLDAHILSIRETCDDTGLAFFSLRTDTPLLNAFINIINGGAIKS